MAQGQPQPPRKPRGPPHQGSVSMSTSTDLKARKAAAVPKGVGTRGVYVAKAENAELWDVDGRRYIDFAAGIAVLNTRHRPPRGMGARGPQTLPVTHPRFHVGPHAAFWRLARRLDALGPADVPQKT